MGALIKGREIELAGAVYVVPPLSLGSMEVLQERLLAFRGGAVDRESVRTAIDAAHAALKRNYPDLTREQVAELVDLGNMGAMIAAIMDISGMTGSAEKKTPAAPTSPSTGTSSTAI